MELFAKKEQQPAQQPGQGMPNAQPAQHGLFSSGPAQPQPAHDTTGEISTLTRKLRINEERVMNIRRKMQVIEHNMLLTQKKLVGEVKFINEEMSDIKRQFEDTKSQIRQLNHEIARNAKKEDVEVLERYINMWEPVTFVTRHEVERIIDEKLQKFK